MHHCSEGSRSCQGNTDLQAMTHPPGNHASSEDKALKEERHSWQSFLQDCGLALQACPHEALGILIYPIHLLIGNMSLTSLLTATSQMPISSRDPISSPSHSRRPTTSTHPTGNEQQHSPRCEAELDHSRDGEPASCHRELHQ